MFAYQLRPRVLRSSTPHQIAFPADVVLNFFLLPLQAFGIGLVHGMGGTAGVGLLLLAAIHSRVLAVAALALFAFCTAVSMSVLSTGLGLTLTTTALRRSFQHVAPALGIGSSSSAPNRPNKSKARADSGSTAAPASNMPMQAV